MVIAMDQRKSTLEGHELSSTALQVKSTLATRLCPLPGPTSGRQGVSELGATTS